LEKCLTYFTEERLSECHELKVTLGASYITPCESSSISKGALLPEIEGFAVLLENWATDKTAWDEVVEKYVPGLSLVFRNMLSKL